MSNLANSPSSSPQFIVVPLTGIQLCRRIMLPPLPDEVWAAACALGEKPKVKNPLLPLVQKHAACDQVNPADTSGWIAANAIEAVFFRVLKIGADYSLDVVVDTQNGSGRQVGNHTRCVVEYGGLFRKKEYLLATVVVEENKKPRNDVGSLIMDFGNSGTSAIFALREARPLESRPVNFHNPWDPFESFESRRPTKEKSILKSTTFVLRAPETNVGSPWVVLGARADELIRQEPMATSLFAPKKYIRHWPEHLKAQEPTTTYRGIIGQQFGLYPMLEFVKWSVTHMIELVQSSLANPTFASAAPVRYAQVADVLLTYPLTWREADRDLFRRMVDDIARKQFVLEPRLATNFRVDLVCSEPVGVAVYALWEVFFRLFDMAPSGQNLRRPSLAASLLGNMDGTQELRLLVVDIGGGSSDIALVRADWSLADDESGNHVNVRVQVLESLRFNRAGDRISHLMAAAVLEFLRRKYGIEESLDFKKPSPNLAFTTSIKREIVSRIMELVERAKAKLAELGAVWTLSDEDEKSLEDLFRSVIALPPDQPRIGRLELTAETLRRWIEDDFGSVKTHGEPGFMDIFFYLRELRQNLEEIGCLPHLVLLSGRTTRLPFIKNMTADSLGMPLHNVRTLDDLLPKSLRSPDHENMDKLAVVYGAHRLRFGDPIRFSFVPEEAVFNRFLGTLTETMTGGLRLNKLLIARGEPRPATRTVRVPPSSSILIGHSFREKDNLAQIVASISNSNNEPRDVEVDFHDDFSASMKRTRSSEGVTLTEWVPGGTSLIVDNFNDTGCIDCEPDGFLRSIVAATAAKWIRD